MPQTKKAPKKKRQSPSKEWKKRNKEFLKEFPEMAGVVADFTGVLFYLDHEKNIVPTNDREGWDKWYRFHSKVRKIGLDLFTAHNGVEHIIETEFRGIDWDAPTTRKPKLLCTTHSWWGDLNCYWYDTYADAVKGHERVVNRVKKMLIKRAEKAGKKLKL